MTKEENPRESRIRNGDMDGVLKGLRETAKMEKGISIVLHDIRYAGEQAHAGTHARAHVSRMELEEILKTLKEAKYSYETFENVCKYGSDDFDKPNIIP